MCASRSWSAASTLRRSPSSAVSSTVRSPTRASALVHRAGRCCRTPRCRSAAPGAPRRRRRPSPPTGRRRLRQRTRKRPVARTSAPSDSSGSRNTSSGRTTVRGGVPGRRGHRPAPERELLREAVHAPPPPVQGEIPRTPVGQDLAGRRLVQRGEDDRAVGGRDDAAESVARPEERDRLAHGALLRLRRRPGCRRVSPRSTRLRPVPGSW